MDEPGKQAGLQGRPAETPGTQTLGSVISNTFTIYGNYFFKMIALSSVFFAFFIAFFVFIIAFVVMFAVSRQGPPLIAWLIFFTLLGLTMLLSMIVRAFVNAMAIVFVADHFLGRASLKRAYRTVAERFWTILAASTLSTLAVLGMTITVIGIPFAIYFGLCWGFIAHAVIFEGCTATAALSRSVGLVRNNWWRVWGIMFVMGLILFAMGLGTYFVPLVSSLAGFIIEPLGPIAMTLLYFDLRTRKENYSPARLESDLARYGSAP